MPEYLAPGVYVEEVDTGSKPIEGVSTSTAGLIGVTERGPVNVPILITSYGEFTRWFGERLSLLDFANGNGFHCYLPQAVEGFFTNGGKRVYVTRIHRNDAVSSALALHDRGSAGGVESVLLRAARQNTGTAVNLPRLLLLAAGGLAAGEIIRVGDGSQAEYRTVVADSATTHVPLSSPLARSHDALTTIHQINRAVNAAFGGGMTLNRAATAGDTQITIDVPTAADWPLLDGAAPGALFLEINTLVPPPPIPAGMSPGQHAEYRSISTVRGTGATRTLTLDSPFVVAYPINTPVTVIDAGVGAAIDTTVLTTPACAGDLLVYGDDLNGNFDVSTDLLVMASGTSGAEIRRIGEIRSLALSRGAYDDYPPGTRVSLVQVANQTHNLSAAAIDRSSLVLSNTTALVAGLQVVVEPGPTEEVRTIRSIDIATDTVTLTSALANLPVRGVIVAVRPRTLTAVAPAGSNTLAIDNRLGLTVGDVLSLGSGATREFVVVTALGGSRGPAPDAGTIVLAGSTQVRHAEAEILERQVVTPASGRHHPVFIVLPVTAGSTTLLVSDNDGFAAGNIVQVDTPTGQVFLHALTANLAVAPREVEVTRPLQRNHELGTPAVQRAPLIQVQALDAGRWGDRLRVSVEDEPEGLVSRATLRDIFSATEIQLSAPTGVEAGTVLELAGANPGNPPIDDLLKVQAINRTNNRITLETPLSIAQQAAHATATGAGQRLRVRSREFRLTVLLMRRSDPAVPTRDDIVQDLERFELLSMDPRHSRYVATIVGDINGSLRLSDRRPEGGSWYVRVGDAEPVVADRQVVRLGPETLVDMLPGGRTRPARHVLEGGDDSIALLADGDYIGVDAVDPEDRTGLQALKNIEEISIVACPGRTSAQLQGELIAHCELMRYRFAVLDGPRQPHDTIADVRALRQQYDTKYAALYHPWLLVTDPYPTNLAQVAEYPIPPSGHVVGIYARTDIERGVHKAPANEVVRGVIGLRRILNKEQQDILNPYPVNINVIRDFRPNNRGIRVYGGRVITSDSDWKYVNVRRLLIFIEASLDRGLQWVVFEPNAEPLWARVTRTIRNFLTVVWRNSALEGTKPEEAFFVKCDRTTMTQADIDNGRLICVIGVAPVKPAEYVIIRIGLWTAHAED